MAWYNRRVRLYPSICFVLIVLISYGDSLALNTVGVNQLQDQAPSNLHTLTVTVEGVNHDGGNIGILVFNAPKGWPEDRFSALRDVAVPAHPGTVTVAIPGLPTANYAVSVAHDVNKNHKVDRNWMGIPKEQWGMSNNPHPTLKIPSFASCRFSLAGDMEIHVKMQ